MSSADGTSTGAQLATAASYQHSILCFGQADLTGRDRDLIAAVQARDQIVAALGGHLAGHDSRAGPGRAR